MGWPLPDQDGLTGSAWGASRKHWTILQTGNVERCGGHPVTTRLMIFRILQDSLL